MSSYDIVALGELLIDFTPVGDRTYQANPGGSPPNLLAAASKLGLSTAFIGTVGQDYFGQLLIDDMKKEKINVDGVIAKEGLDTTLAYVHLGHDGDRSFTFIRNADGKILPEDVDFSIIDRAKVYHFSSVTMSVHPARETNYQVLDYVRGKGIPVSYDPNLRPTLWNSLGDAKEVISKCLGLADVVKISEEELEFVFGHDDWEKGAREILARGANLVFVTLGAKGCIYAHGDIIGRLPTYKVDVVDTTGAGDAFMGGALSFISRSGKSCKDSFAAQELEDMAKFANAVGSLATTKKGGVTGMPTLEEVEACIRAGVTA